MSCINRLTRLLIKNNKHLFFTNRVYQQSNTIERNSTNSMISSKFLSSKVVELYKLSKNVRGLKLLVEDNQFAFKAGQWIDFQVPGLPQLTGFSICSSPEYFKETKLIELAVKYTTFPPTKWVHDECKLNSPVHISPGGDFYYDINEPPNKGMDVLLLAGGVGINPLLSIFRHIARHSDARNNSIHVGDKELPKVLLLYSVAKFEDFIFKDNIINEISTRPNLSCEFLITSEEVDSSEELSPRVKITSANRLNKQSLEARLANHFESKEKVNSYICGPSTMINDLNQSLLDIGLSQNQIKFEKWW